MRRTLLVEAPEPVVKPGREKYTKDIIEQSRQDLLAAARAGKGIQIELEGDDTATGIKGLFGSIAREEGIKIRFHTQKYRTRASHGGREVKEPSVLYLAIKDDSEN